MVRKIYLNNVVRRGRVRPEADLWHASRALDVEPVYSEAEIVHVIHVFFTSIELATLQIVDRI